MIQYIDKDALVAEIERRTKEHHSGYLVCLKDILSFIDSMKEEPVSESINFEQELYKAFGQVKDFTLGVRIAKRFYDMGKNSQEPVSEELEEEIIRYVGYPQEVDEDISTTMIRKAARHFANWQKEQIKLTLEDIETILNVENDILRECNIKKELVIETYPKGKDYYGEILKRFKERKEK